MHPAARHILFAGISFIVISTLYFFSVALHLPFIITLAAVVAALYFTGKWFYNSSLPKAENNSSWWVFIVLGIALFLLAARASALAEVHGEWDAWAIWNLHTQYLLDPDNWHLITRNIEYGHPDYPMGLPAFNAFSIRLSGGNSTVITPFVVSVAFCLAIPAFVFINTAKRSLLVAIPALYFMGQDVFYLQRGIAQLADTPLAFFFLCAVACMYHYRENPQYIPLSAFFAASCMWIKNEGAVLAGIFLLFNINTYVKSKKMKQVAVAIAIPLITFVCYKVFYATPNDMVGGQGKDSFTRFSDPQRYKMIYDSFCKNLNGNFYYIKIGVLAYLLISLLRWRWPDRQFLMLSTCLVAYFFFYVFTPNDLEWHLNTSQNRLMHQLMPSFLFVLAHHFSALASGDTPLPDLKFRKSARASGTNENP